jgi:hypothetical protein
VDRIQPIPPRPPAVQPIPALRRTDRPEEKRQREDEEQRRRKRRQPAPEPPPDDGQPHIDVRV